MAPTFVPGCCHDPVLCPGTCRSGHAINGGIWRWYIDGGVTPWPYPSYIGVGRIAVDNDAGKIGIDAAGLGGLGTTYTGHAPITVDGSVIGIMPFDAGHPVYTGHAPITVDGSVIGIGTINQHRYRRGARLGIGLARWASGRHGRAGRDDGRRRVGR